MKTWLRSVLLSAVVANLACACGTDVSESTVTDGSQVVVGSDVIHQSEGKVSGLRTITVEGTSIRIATWTETLKGSVTSWFAINQGKGWSDAKKTSYEVPFHSRRIDPAKEVQSATRQNDGVDLHVVQFVSQPLPAFWKAIQKEGAEVHHFLHGNSQLVRGDGKTMARLAKLSFVRAITPLRAPEKIEPTLTRRDANLIPVNLVLVDSAKDRAIVQDRIVALGGKIKVSDPTNILIEADVLASDVPELASLPQTLWLEEAAPIENDYDIANQQGGAEFLKGLPAVAPEVPGYTGVGIRGHIIEGIDPNHPDFAATDFRTIPVAVDAPAADSHGMQTFGIVFGSGVGNARAKGLLPNGQGFYTNNSAVINTPEGSRSTLVGKLIADNKVMFQTASWGNGLVKTYGAKSAEMDALILKHDLPITQSQSNSGSQQSRPQAWAKNIISVGALYHFGTLTTDDDKWNRSGSTGPAADGSIKPDLCFYFDKTITTRLNNGYSNDFGGTSGATPTVAGHVGLSIEMWTNGVFGNDLIARADGEDLVSFRFKNRPHFTTTKALLINSARQHQFEGETHDRSRFKQGWGIPDLQSLFNRRSNILVVNETDVLKTLEKKTYSFVVPAGAPDFRATLVYADKEAAVPSTITRVNNLDLKVTAPDGTIYWGNNGLKAGLTSTPGGEHNTLDTVENVLLNAPQAGTWTVEVIADEVNADTHGETSETDADYALVVSTVTN